MFLYAFTTFLSIKRNFNLKKIKVKINSPHDILSIYLTFFFNRGSLLSCTGCDAQKLPRPMTLTVSPTLTLEPSGTIIPFPSHFLVVYSVIHHEWVSEITSSDCKNIIINHFGLHSFTRNNI